MTHSEIDASMAPTSGGRPRTLLLLASLLLLSLPPLLIHPAGRENMNNMERLAILSAQETWLRWHAGDRTALLIPSMHERPRLEKPPLTVWMAMLAWSDLDPATVDPITTIVRARRVAAGVALVLLASVFWIGCTLGDRRLGAIALLVAATAWFVERQGRSASYDIHIAAWAALSVASALWAMNPFRPAPSLVRRVVGWLLCAIALAASWMSKNPLALLFVLTAFISVIILEPRRRVERVLWMIGATALAFAIVQPWYWYIDAAIPNAAEIRAREYASVRKEYQGPHYYLGLLGLIAPWTLWFVAGLAHPFTARGEERRIRLVPWLWFLLIFVPLSCHPAKQQRYILPVMAAAALLVAFVWRDHQSQAQRGEPNPGGRRLGIVHWSVSLVASVAMAIFMLGQDQFVQWGWMETPALGTPTSIISLSIGLALVACAIMGWRAHAAWKPGRAFAFAIAWAMILTTTLWYGYADSPGGDNETRPDALRLRAHVGNAPLYFLTREDGFLSVGDDLRLFSLKRMPPRSLAELETVVSSAEGPVFLLTNPDRTREEAIEALGFARIDTLFAPPGQALDLWRAE